VELWTCATREHRTAAPSLAAALPAVELERIERLRSPEQRADALLGAVFLRAVLAPRVDADPAALRFAAACARCGHPTHGKPRLAGLPGPTPSFSLSHSAGLAVLAIGDAEVGVDVEAVAPQDGLATSRIALSDAERGELAALPPDARDERLLELWTRKEAYLKGIGVGVVHDPALVTFAPAQETWEAVLDAGGATGWHVRPLGGLGGGWIGALALEGPPQPVERRSWSPRLLLDRDD
jgi:4'-phosphopantetheinyl transferase